MPDPKEQFEFECLLERPGLAVIVGNRRVNGRTAVMAGGPGGGWFRAIDVVGANHEARAAHYVAAYRERHGRVRVGR